MTPAERFKAAIDDAVRGEADRIFARVFASFQEARLMVALCEARDPFFPRDRSGEDSE